MSPSTGFRPTADRPFSRAGAPAPGQPGGHRRVRRWLREVEAGRFPAVQCLAAEWQRVVEQGLGGEDLTVVTRALSRAGGA